MAQYGDSRMLEKTATQVVAMALDKGAETAAVTLRQKAAFETTVRHGETEGLSQAESKSLSLSISTGGRRASISSCDTSEHSLSALVDMALSMCKYTDSDPHHSLPDPDLLARENLALDLFDPSLPIMEPGEKIKFARDLEALMLARDPQVTSEGATVVTRLTNSTLANSLGFCRSQSTSLIEASVGAFIEDTSAGDLNRGRKQTSGWLSLARHKNDLESQEYIATQAIERLRRKLGAIKPKTAKVPVYFEPKFARTLWAHLLSALTGSAVYRNETYLAGKLGKAIAASCVNLRDDPTIPRGLSSKSYDNEGVACRRRDLIRDGVLQTWLMNTYSANKLGLSATGHAGGPGNLIIEPGVASEAEMLAQMDRGVWVTGLLGQGVNTSTGDYSRGALGLWIENGRVSHPIAEFTLNSNLDQMFRGIVMLGNNVYEPASIRTPGLVIEEMSVSGA